jgi:isopentenyl phosphate kinase
MLTFVKLGGSLITDKRTELSFHQARVERLANEVRAALDANPALKLVIGHGSGAFGHFAARRYHTVEGVHMDDEWRGFAHVATVAAELNYRVASVFAAAALPIWRIQPSASLMCQDGVIESMALRPIQQALEHHLIPLVYGDVALDKVRGGTIISTEKLFAYLAHHLPVGRILLLGEVEGVYGDGGSIIPEINPANFQALAPSIGGAAGTDVTGGMSAKVQDMLRLVQSLPHVTVHIVSGTQPDLLRQALASAHIAFGTAIRNSPTTGLKNDRPDHSRPTLSG